MLYFRGCTAREKQTTIQKATESLLNLAGVDYHMLENEKCCGSVLLRTGFVDEAKEQIEKNSEIFKDEKILTSCAGCYKTLSEDYDDVDVVHISQFLDELIKQGKFDFTKKDLDVTYHDSCHLGRHSGIFDEPRKVINEVADLIEMETSSFSLMTDLFEVPGIALLVVSDNSASADPLVGRSEEQQRRYDYGRKVVLPDMILAVAGS